MKTRRSPKGLGVPSWDGNACRYTIHVGYHLDSSWKRQRTRHYFGGDEAAAHLEAMRLRQEWLRNKSVWPRFQKTLVSYFSEHDWSKPVWVVGLHSEWIRSQLQKKTAVLLGHAQEANEWVEGMEAQQRREALWSVLEKALIEDRRSASVVLASLGLKPASDDGLDATLTAANVTIAEAKDRYLEARRKRVGIMGRKGIKPTTYHGIRTHLLCSLGLPLGKRPKVFRSPPLDLNNVSST